MRRLCVFVFAVLAVSLPSPAIVKIYAGPATQFGLYNSGVDDDQFPLLDNDVDPHYELIDISHILGDPIVATSAGGFPIGPWLADNDLSAWITPSEDTNGPGDFDGAPSYVYRTSFDLTGVDVGDLQIVGRWSSDNSGQDILLNDVSMGFTNTAQFGGFTPFTLEAEFVQGVNTVDFVINNGGNEDNPDGPTGLRVEFDGNGPPPSPPHPNAIPGLFNTGVDVNGASLFGDAVPDPHYEIVLGPAGDPMEALTVPSDGFPIPPWLPNGSGSRWISPPDIFDGHDANGEPGTYLYQTTFDLTGMDSDNVAIVGTWSTDNDGATILLNGVPLSAVNTLGFTASTWFGINAAAASAAGAELLPGENTLTFHVENAGDDVNPTGLRVDELFARAAPAGSSPIPGLFNTGVDDQGQLLDFDSDDPNYAQVEAPDGAEPPATALSGPPGSWVNNTESSQWIGPLNNVDGTAPPGDYEYEIEFDLTGLDPSTAVIMGLWSADNTGGDILLNGEPTDNAQQGSFPQFSEFEITAEAGHNFLQGANTLTFLVNNAGDADNPIGLRVEGLVAYAFSGGLGGDYDNNGVVNAADIDLQADAMKDPNPDLGVFDEDGNGRVDGADRLIWVKDHARTWVGDSDLNGEFNSGDLVIVFTAGKYETQEMATWGEGDWDGNMTFDSGDLVAAFTDGGYELGPLPGVAAVPEPSSLLLFLLGALCAFRRKRR